ncbi:ABC transporter ATP-binding protein [Halosquirtibacter xylanolyticus]|uniref:ABC transporter ATP-binding protein n=1 Tax=Halosquirtibacter xylanolyticus TaxID=3374599 RepID=UPI003748D8BC|nr:ABC transporter ATP-binding protein [Prolixibacteraceae bacterium]
MQPIIECNNITHYYGERLIYRDINFQVEKGKILGLLGKNGTGKTTIINILTGYLKPTSGTCKIFGESMQNMSTKNISNIGLLLEGHIQHDFFNIHQIEKYYSRFFNNWKPKAYWNLMQHLKVGPKQKISTMSCGQRSQVALGLLLAQDPELLILDDFSMGLDPGYRRLFVEFLKEYAQSENKTIFLTSHIIQDMEHLIDDCMIMDYGGLLLHKPTKDIIEGFRRYTIPKEVPISLFSEGQFYSTEEKQTHIETYSFLSIEETSQLIYKEAGKNLEFKSELLSLEDAFIGLTGKY